MNANKVVDEILADYAKGKKTYKPFVHTSDCADGKRQIRKGHRKSRSACAI